MNNNTLVASFSIFAIIALSSTILIFQQTTFTGKATTHYPKLSQERFLAREPCEYVEAELGLSTKDCEMIGRIDCHKKYGIPMNYKGDARVNSMNCLNECNNDIRAQCEYAQSAFFREGRRD